MSRRFLTPVNLPKGTTLPSVGSAGDLFYKSDEQKIYVHDGSAWVLAQGSNSSVFDVSATPPADPVEGATWYNSTDGSVYVYYDNQWVDTSVGVEGPTGPTGPAGPTGATGATGPAGEGVTAMSLLTDVSLFDLLAGDILLYNSGSSMWENTPLGSVLFSEESAAWQRNNVLQVLLETGLVTTDGGSYNTTSFAGTMDGGFYNTTSFTVGYDGGSAGSI